MSAPEVVSHHSDLELAEYNREEKSSDWSSMKQLNGDYRHVAQPSQPSQPSYSQPTYLQPTYSQPSYSQPDSSYPQAVPPSKSRTTCGLPSKIFWIVVAILILVLGIGLGAGVGAGMSIQRGMQETTSGAPTATVTQTITATGAQGTGTAVVPTVSPTSPASSSASSYSPNTLVKAVIPTNGTVALDCPTIDASIIRIALGSTTYRFAVACGTDTAAANQDILAVIVYSIEACAQACASYNRNYGQNKCVAATFNSNLTASVGVNYGSCWLKNGTVGTSPSTSNIYAGLRLQI